MKIRISSQEWELKINKRQAGGNFDSLPKKGKCGVIIVGSKSNSFSPGTLVHEVIEATLAMDKKRYTKDDGDYLFSFDHDYLDDFCKKIADSLKSIGVNLTPRKQRRK